jgi:hypothetical protein
MKDENSFPKPRLVIFLVCLTLLTFLLIIIFFTQNDFWQDELYAMNHFVFVPWRTIFTDYHSTNNHIAFDLFAKAYSKIFGINTSCNAVQHPILMRKIPLIFTLAAIIYFYFQAKKNYGKNFSLIAISILCSTMVFADFAVQFRGYSLSLLLTTMQFFSFLKIARAEKQNLVPWLILFFSTALNLLCLPSSVYFSITLTLLASLALSPASSQFFFGREISKLTAIKLLLCLVIVMVSTLLYYRWLVQQQPGNELLNSFNLFSGKNLLQALAIFYHFTDYRFYFFVFTAIYFVRRIRYWNNFSAANFPLFCFFVPFILYFIHGPVIVQRIFVPLIPFFAIAMTAIIGDIFSSQKKRTWIYVLLTANWLCLVFGFMHLESASRKNNLNSNHQQDLLNHYYLVSYNAQQTADIVGNLQDERRLLVLDDFGETGIKYYLSCYGVKFENFSGATDLKKNDVIITNNKIVVENELAQSQRHFLKKLPDDQQYQVYLIN